MATLAKYDKFLLGQMDGTSNAVIDFNTDTIKVAVHTSTYSPSASADDFWNDATNEVSGSNYTSGGATVSTPTVNLSSGTVTFDGDDVTWSAHASGFANGRTGVLYKSTGTASTSRLIGYIDFVADKGNQGGDLTIQWNASGIITWA